MLCCWAAVLIPAFAGIPHLREWPHTGIVALGATILVAIGLAAMLIDRQRSEQDDWLSGSVVIRLAAPAGAPTA